MITRTGGPAEQWVDERLNCQYWTVAFGWTTSTNTKQTLYQARNQTVPHSQPGLRQHYRLSSIDLLYICWGEQQSTDQLSKHNHFLRQCIKTFYFHCLYDLMHFQPFLLVSSDFRLNSCSATEHWNPTIMFPKMKQSVALLWLFSAARSCFLKPFGNTVNHCCHI